MGGALAVPSTVTALTVLGGPLAITTAVVNQMETDVTKGAPPAPAT
jgi:hypothetical protein